MTAHRRPTIRFSEAPRGQCRWCGEPILHASGERRGEVNRRRRWHPKCVDQYNASDPGEVRRMLRKRDRGRCAICRLDTNALRRELKGRGRARKLRERGFKPRQSLWEVDHVVPLIDGGGHAADNLQTLCTPCHKLKTAEEARSRAAQSRITPTPATAPTVPAAAPTARPPSPVAPVASRARSLDELLERADRVNERAASLLAGFTSS
jgi:5-methylcytosine-specific restriction endonuclease McrA